MTSYEVQKCCYDTKDSVIDFFIVFYDTSSLPLKHIPHYGNNYLYTYFQSFWHTNLIPIINFCTPWAAETYCCKIQGKIEA